MKITVTQWQQVTMVKTVEIPTEIPNLHDAKDYAYEHGEWTIAKTHVTDSAVYEVEE